MSARASPSLRFQLTGTFVAMAVVPTLLLGVAAIGYGVRQVREQVTERNEQLALAISGEVSRFLDAQLVHVREVALAVEAGRPSPERISALLSLELRANPALTAVLVLDRTGFVRHLAPFDEDLRGVDLSGEPFVRRAWATKEPTWSSATISMRTGLPLVTLVVPGETWTVVAHLDLDALEGIVARTRTTPSEEVAVIDRDGTFIAHREARLVRQQVNVRDLAIVRAALAGGGETAVYSFLGREWLGSTSTVPPTQWVVLVAEPLELAYRRVYGLRHLLLLVLGAVVTAAVVVGVLSARRIVRPLELLSARLRRVAAGEYASASLGPRRQAFRELDELAVSFATMAAAVRGREEELARSEKNLRVIVSTPVVGVVRTRLDGEILFSNEAFARMVHADGPASLAGRNVVEFYAEPADRARILEQVLATGRAVNVEIRVRASGGGATHLLANVARDGDVLTTVTVEISDLKAAAAERERLEQQLFHAQKLEAVGRLAGGVAHDFNNLLTAIVGFASLLRDSLSGDEAARENAEGILECTQRAAHLTQSLLAYSRKQVLQRRPVDLVQILNAIEKLLRRVIGEDVELSLEVPERGLTAVVDPGQIEQVLLNLCTNARDAMPAGGRLRIEGEPVRIGRDEATRLGLSRPGAYVRIRVVDGGEGMSREVVERLFEPFFTTKPPGKGTGLGLAIVHGIVHQHEGAVSAESAVGRGTTVTVLLPAAERIGEPDRARGASAAAGGRETILLAEDEPLVRKVLRRALERAGYDVVEAVDGEDAVRKFAENRERVALCLLDVVMPRMNGRESAQAIRAMRPGIRVLLASGYAADVLQDRGLESTGAELISKPIAPDELLGKIREMLDRAA